MPLVCTEKVDPSHPHSLEHDAMVTCADMYMGTCLSQLMTLLTTPAPTVLPPSRTANRRPGSMATGANSSNSALTLSPGITISVPDGRVTHPAYRYISHCSSC